MSVPDLSDPQRRAILWLAEHITSGKPPTHRVLIGLRERGYVSEHEPKGERRRWVLTKAGKALVDQLLTYLNRKTVATTAAPWFRKDPRRACRTADPFLFFPPIGGAAQAAEAKRVCHTCPLFTDCLDYALPITDLHGIWAGTNPGDRAAIRRGAKPRPDELVVAA